MDNGYLGQGINIGLTCAKRPKSRDDTAGELPIRVVLCGRGVVFVLTIKRDQCNIDRRVAHAIKGAIRAASCNPTVVLNGLRGALRHKLRTYDVARSSEHGNRETHGD